MLQRSEPRLHLDHHISRRVAEQLRNRGFDVTSSQELRMDRATDAEQLAYAVANQRAIVTADYGDYSRLNTHYLLAGQEHWGIILTEQYPIGTMVNYLLRLLF